MKKNIIITLSVLCLFACKESNMPAPTLNVEAVTLNQESLQLAVGASATLVATVKPKNAATVEWSSSNPAIAVVVNGQVTGVAEGIAVVAAAAGSKVATCVVSVGNGGNQNGQGGLTSFEQYLTGSDYYVANMPHRALRLTELPVLWIYGTAMLRMPTLAHARVLRHSVTPMWIGCTGNPVRLLGEIYVVVFASGVNVILLV